MDELEVTEVWRLYQEGMEQHSRTGLQDRTEQAYRFYEGDQWHGLETEGEKLPFYNFIRPTVNYRASMVAMNRVEIVYNPIGADEGAEQVCGELTRRAAAQWERTKMDRTCWKAIKDACIAGDSYIYFYDDQGHAQVVGNTDIFLADEQEPDLQKQGYILIRERRPVEDVRAEGLKNGLSEEDVDLILPDSDATKQTGSEAAEEVGKDRKCTCLLLLRKKNGVISTLRSTQRVIYQPETELSAADGDGATYRLTKYPLVNLIWNQKKGSARGVGEVWPLIPNQIETNRNLVRRSVAVKLCAFGKPVYREGAIQNPEALAEAGSAICVRDISAANVRDVVSYLEPASMSGDAMALGEELVNRTRELAGAGDAATGQIDPTKTSGVAIIAARDQSAIPLNEQTAAFQQMAEDIALVWLDIWAAYETNGIPREGGVISPEELRKLQALVKVDITPTDPFSKYAVEQSLENALAAGQIDFGEYVRALPDNAAAPKAKFMEILDRREQLAREMREGGIQDALPPVQNGYGAGPQDPLGGGGLPVPQFQMPQI